MSDDIVWCQCPKLNTAHRYRPNLGAHEGVACPPQPVPLDEDGEQDKQAAQYVARWANGLTDADIEAMAEEATKGAVFIVGFAQTLGKIKQAHDTGLSHVVLTQDEIKYLLTGLRTLTSKNPTSRKV
jgi:hypothetical protein